MGQKTFADRLSTVTRKYGQSEKVAQEVHTKENLSKREKIMVSLRILEKKGISTTKSYPPLYWGLHKIGIYPRPLHYKSMRSLFVMGMLLIIVIFGGILTLGIGENIAKGPVAGLYRAGWIGVFVMSLMGGAVFAAVIRNKATSCGIPRWSDIWQ